MNFLLAFSGLRNVVYTHMSQYIHAQVKLSSLFTDTSNIIQYTHVLNMFEAIVQSGENFSGFCSVTSKHVAPLL